MLVLEIEYLTGVAVAASAYDRATPEWPPHPDRVFSALISAWAERGKDPAERAALEWLERLGPPEIAASKATQRGVVDVFVPPNDMSVSGKVGSGLPKDPSASLAVLPTLRKNRQPRQFPAVIPEHRVLHVFWPTADEKETAQHKAALREVARNVPYLGHSSSLVRMAVRENDFSGQVTHEPAVDGELRLRAPYSGRMQELVQGYRDDAHRDRGWRPRRAPAVAYQEVRRAAPKPKQTVFGEEWVILADARGEVPALEAIPIVTKRLRDALMDHAEAPVPEVLSGHAPNQSPSRDPHLAIVPLADVGWRYSSGRVMGLGLILPRELEQAHRSPERRNVLQAIARFSTGVDGGSGALRLGQLGVWLLCREMQPEALSRQPLRYLRTARRWGTVTPFVFDRFPKDKEGQDAAAIVAQACTNIGLPPPIEIELHKHSAFRGAPSAKRHRGEPASVGYRFPKGSALANRPLCHMVLTFEEPVGGPVILGAGRFQGLGLCLPVAGEAAP